MNTMPGHRWFRVLSGTVPSLPHGSIQSGPVEFKLGETLIRMRLDPLGPIRQDDRLIVAVRPCIVPRGRLKGIACVLEGNGKVLAGDRAVSRWNAVWSGVAATFFFARERRVFFLFGVALAGLALFSLLVWLETELAVRALRTWIGTQQNPPNAATSSARQIGDSDRLVSAPIEAPKRFLSGYESLPFYLFWSTAIVLVFHGAYLLDRVIFEPRRIQTSLLGYQAAAGLPKTHVRERSADGTVWSLWTYELTPERAETLRKLCKEKTRLESYDPRQIFSHNEPLEGCEIAKGASRNKDGTNEVLLGGSIMQILHIELRRATR